MPLSKALKKWMIRGAAIVVVSAVIVMGFLSSRQLSRPAIEIFVGNRLVNASGFATVAAFPGNSTGDVAPISEFYTNQVRAVALDPAGNIYVSSASGDVSVYAPGSAGAAQRVRRITGTLTHLFDPMGIAVDLQGNVYVADFGSPTLPSAVLKFGPGADGNVAPLAIIPASGSNVLGAPAVNTVFNKARGVAVDETDGSIYVATTSGLMRFAANANGDVAPLVVLDSGPRPVKLAIDRTGTIFVIAHPSPPSIEVYAASPVANVPPIRTISSPEMTLPTAIAVDASSKLFITNDSGPDSGSVLVFDAAASGSVQPLRNLKGSATRLSAPSGIAVRSFPLTAPPPPPPPTGPVN